MTKNNDTKEQMDENKTLLHSREFCCDPGINSFHRTNIIEGVTCLKCLRVVIKHLGLVNDILGGKDYAGKLIKNTHYEWVGALRPVCGNCCMFRPCDCKGEPYCALDGHCTSASDKTGYERVGCWLPDDSIPSFIVLKFIQEIWTHDQE